MLTTDEKDGLEKCDGSVTKEISARKGKEAPSANREGKKRLASPDSARNKMNECSGGRGHCAWEWGLDEHGNKGEMRG